MPGSLGGGGLLYNHRQISLTVFYSKLCTGQDENKKVAIRPDD